MKHAGDLSSELWMLCYIRMGCRNDPDNCEQFFDTFGNAFGIDRSFMKDLVKPADTSLKGFDGVGEDVMDGIDCDMEGADIYGGDIGSKPVMDDATGKETTDRDQ